MNKAPWLAIVLVLAVPASAAGHGRSSSGRSTRLSTHPALGRSMPPLRSYSQSRFATRSTFVGSQRSANGFAGPSGFSGARVSRFNSASTPANTPKGNVPTNGGSTSATAGTPGAPISGTMNHATYVGAAGGGGAQGVAGGEIQQNAATAADVGRSPGVTWAAPDTPPSGGSAGGGGATTNH